MSHDEFIEEILNINPKIRFVGIFYNGDYHTKIREGLKPLLNKEETQTSMRHAILRMSGRKLLAHKIGNTHYAMAKYDKMTRISISFGKDGLIMVTTENDAEYDPIAEKVLELRKKYEYLLS